MSDLNGRVVIVTGGGRGIGRSEALLLAQNGARVIVNDLGCEIDGTGADPTVAEATADQILAESGIAIAHCGDVSEQSTAQSLVELALNEWGRLDAVVNNAGTLRDWMIYNMQVDDWDHIVSSHLRSTFLLTREACRHWRAQAASTGSTAGRIINTTSVSGLRGNRGQTNYGAAKAAIAAFTQISALEMYRYGVTVNAIAPAARTRGVEQAFGAIPVPESEFDRWNPDNVAPLVAYLASNRASDITGQVFGVYGGTIELYRGWTVAAALQETERFSISEIHERLRGLFNGGPTVYEPAPLPEF